MSAVAIGEGLSDFFLHDVDQAPVRKGHINFSEFFHVEHPHREGDRDVDGIVEIQAEAVALGSHHTDNAQSGVGNSNKLTQRIVVPEEFAFYLGPEHRNRARAMRVGVVEKLSLADLELPDIEHSGGRSVDDDTAGAPLLFDARERNHQWHDLINMGKPFDGDGIFDREFSRRPAKGSRNSAGFRLARIDHEYVCAELRELVQNVDPSSLSNGSQQHDRSHSDRNPEHRERRSHLVGSERPATHQEKISALHAPPSPCSIARRSDPGASHAALAGRRRPPPHRRKDRAPR